MDKTSIKNFAVWARRKLIEDIQQKAYEIGITEKEIKEPQVVTSDTMIIGDRTLNRAEMNQRKSLVSRVKEKGFNNVVEEVAYTWFNRFIALRFMEVNEYLPTGVRVLSSNEPGKKEPDIIKDALNTDLELDRDLVYKLQDSHDVETLYRYLIVKQCNTLNEILPGLFEEIENYTEILLPSNLLAEGSIIRQLVESIPEDNFREQVEIIGWMYQYYISEKKDEVFSKLEDNIKITKENIPAATQLFTPEWIVKYMIENTLGKLWLENNPNEELRSNWRYYLEEAQQENSVKRQLKEIREKSNVLKPEEIKVLDCCMGSGHILTYCFDVFYDIYKSVGYSERDIPKLILENNLYGLDIDDRAAQLAYFAVMMKARSRNRRIFKEKINLNICAIQESNGLSKDTLNYLVSQYKNDADKKKFSENVGNLINLFHDAKEYGSILDISSIDYIAIEKTVEEIRDSVSLDLFEYQHKEIMLQRIPALIKQARIMSQKYDVVCTNPPYMGKKGMSKKLTEYVSKRFPNTKTDLFSVFIEKGFCYSKPDRYVSMVTMQAWLFIKSFSKLRSRIINEMTVDSLLQIGYNSFPELNSKIAHACSFVIRNAKVDGYKGKYFNLNNVDFTADKEKVYLSRVENNEVYLRKLSDFMHIPENIFAYWISNHMLDIYIKMPKLSDYATVTNGLFTCNNDYFLRHWFEVSINKCNFSCKDKSETYNDGILWYPYNKGGAYRKWYGNHEHVVRFTNNGQEIREYRVKQGQSESFPGAEFYFQESLSWSFISTASFSIRCYPKGFVFDIAGSSIFTDEYYRGYLLGFLSTKIASEFLRVNPTVNFQAGNIATLPTIISTDEEKRDIIVNYVKNCIELSKDDWNSFETSWDFKTHPLMIYKSENSGKKTIEYAVNNWTKVSNENYYKLREIEEKINSIFIEIYGLQQEISPNLEDKEISMYRADREKDIKSFISYAIGCMLGRYSIDVQGLIYAGIDFKDKWKCDDGQCKVKRIVKDENGQVTEASWVHTNFSPDIDNILPITDDEYFEDDIITRFVEFVKGTFGEETLEENLDYIADTLGRKSSETSRQTIRRYFLKEFFKDHVQTYQKKPIYWLFDSGKQDGFKALIYIHRYDEFTVAKVRTDYLHKLQKSYEAEVKRLDIVIDSSASERDKVNARKKKEKIMKQMEECRQYDQVIAHVANQRIQIDLDDGVSVNYSKFQGVEIPQGDGKKPLKADLLAKI